MLCWKSQRAARGARGGEPAAFCTSAKPAIAERLEVGRLEGDGPVPGVEHVLRGQRIEDVPKPTAGTGEVVLRVQRCLVCGTDKRIFTHGRKNVAQPAITGHETVGTVYEMGSGVDYGLPIGQKTVVGPVVGCGKCVYCQSKQYNLCDSFTAVGYDYAGGFAEYVKIPAAAVAQGPTSQQVT